MYLCTYYYKYICVTDKKKHFPFACDLDNKNRGSGIVNPLLPSWTYKRRSAKNVI